MINLKDLIGEEDLLKKEKTPFQIPIPNHSRDALARKNFLKDQFDQFVRDMDFHPDRKPEPLTMDALYTGYFLGATEFLFALMAHLKHYPNRDDLLSLWLIQRAQEITAEQELSSD